MKKFLLLILAMLAVSSTADAAKVDAYRALLESKSYTIRYDNLTPAPRVTNRDVVELYGKSGLAVEGNDYFLNRPLSGVITSRGEDRYEEVGYADFFQCRLMRGGENFIFTRYKNKKGAVEYFGRDKGKVSANTRNYLTELLTGESFGDANFSEMMNAIIADSHKSAGSEKYALINSGTLDGGLDFEDFLAQDENKISAIRFYFDGENLVKIAYASYGRDADGSARGSKCIVKIREFSGSPDDKLLKLPAGLKDETKR